MELTESEQEWNGEFGKFYLTRNNLNVNQLNELYFKNYGISRNQLNLEFLGEIDRKVRILEIGCNIGNQLKLLQAMGFSDLWGIEISMEAFELAKTNTKNINVVRCSAFDIPFKDNYFDLVFTSGVLIHINPNDLKLIMDNIYRLSKIWIWGFEYYADELTALSYRGKEGLMWKNNFLKYYMERYPNLKIIREKKLKYSSNENIDQMFLLKKSS